MKIYDLSVMIYGSVRAETVEDALEEFVLRIRSGEIDIPEPTIESSTDLSAD
jgi:hypothetical protein